MNPLNAIVIGKLFLIANHYVNRDLGSNNNWPVIVLGLLREASRVGECGFNRTYFVRLYCYLTEQFLIRLE